MSLQVYYEDSYQSEAKRSTEDLSADAILSSKGLYHFVLESKNKFLAHRDWSDLKILETGSGRGGLSLLLAKLGARVTIIDFSPSALEQAKIIFQKEGLEVDVHQADVTFPDVSIPDKFDIVVDSHLLHCLTEDPDRASYYKLITDHLGPEGIFVAETMVHRKKLFIPDGFMFDERNVLWQMIGGWTPVRRILDSLDLEKELNEADFKISYFYYYGQFGFVPHRNFMDLPTEILPAAVRMVLQNKNEQG